MGVPSKAVLANTVPDVFERILRAKESHPLGLRRVVMNSSDELSEICRVDIEKMKVYPGILY